MLWFTENTIYAFGLCFDIIVKGTLKWLVIFRYIEEGATLTLKIMSKIPTYLISALTLSHLAFQNYEKAFDTGAIFRRNIRLT